MTPSGNLIWAKSAGGSGVDNATSIALDYAGNANITGYFSGTANFGGIILSSAGVNNIFNAKYDPNGNLLWAKSAGGLNGAYSQGISVDTLGNSYITGDFEGTANFSGLSLTGSGGFDIFIAKYDPSGNILWAKKAGGASHDYGKSIAIEQGGNIYITGHFQHIADFSGISLTSLNGLTMFIAKYDPSGNILWAKGGSVSNECLSQAITVDAAGNAYVTGRFLGDLSLGNTSISSIGGYDLFVAKYAPNGNTLWALNAGGLGGEIGHTIDLTSGSFVVVSGNYYATASSYAQFGTLILNYFGNSEFSAKILDNSTFPTYVAGKTFQNNTALPCNPASPGINFNYLKAVKGNNTFYGYAQPNGQYRVGVADTGTYTVSQLIPAYQGMLQQQACPSPVLSHTASLAAIGDSATGKNFGITTATLCPWLSVDVKSIRRRYCLKNNTYVAYQNTGFAPAQNVFITLKFPEHVVFVSADKPHTFNPIDSTYRFDIGTLGANQGGQIHIIDSVKCGNINIMNLTQCTKAAIYPKNTCIPSIVNYSGASLVASARCLGSTAEFVIKNTGPGSMLDSSAYKLFADSTLIVQGKVKLNAGDSTVFTIQTLAGVAFLLNAEQVPNHPTNLFVTALLTDCFNAPTTPVVSSGAILKNAIHNGELATSIHCLPILNSYDPNDKTPSPRGFGPQGYLMPGKAHAIDYVIRFQNMGTDTAFTVMILDTLSANLDFSTLVMGAASHNFTYEVSGKNRPIIRVMFNNINLPHKAINDLGSQGFVSFKISTYAGLSLQSTVKNFADIYFDYNPAVRTNTTLHTIFDYSTQPGYSNFALGQQLVGIEKGAATHSDFKLYPNPNAGSFNISGVQAGERITIRDIVGKTVLQQTAFENQSIQLPLGAKGLYFVQVGKRAVQKVVVE